jgi:hypothetical protein
MLSLLMDPLFAPRAFWRRPLSVGTRPTVMTCKKPVPKNRVSPEIDPVIPPFFGIKQNQLNPSHVTA